MTKQVKWKYANFPTYTNFRTSPSFWSELHACRVSWLYLTWLPASVTVLSGGPAAVGVSRTTIAMMTCKHTNTHTGRQYRPRCLRTSWFIASLFQLEISQIRTHFCRAASGGPVALKLHSSTLLYGPTVSLIVMNTEKIITQLQGGNFRVWLIDLVSTSGEQPTQTTGTLFVTGTQEEC